ncbi:MAG: FG-GAP-like repeat-containing protein, partial [Rubripirellula sp.]
MTIRSSSSHRCKRAFKRRLILESLEARHLLAADFGDAPAPYPVTLEENGARHESVGPTLGLVRDSEVNGTHSANADSDGIDEDAVLSEFDLQATVGANPAVTMLVSNPTGSEATLAGWIDYDQDGSFEASERATAVISPGTGSERVTLLFPDIPEGAAGNTFARFRFSTDASFTSNPSPVGLATDGEVEDYAFTFVSQTAGTVRKSVKLASLLNGVPAISTGNFYHAPTTIGDFDGDGIDDLVVASRGLSGQNQPGSVYLHRMKEDGTVRETTSFSINSPNFGTDVTAAGDINGDGVTDLVVGSNVADGGNGAVFVTFLNSDGTLQSSTKIGTNLNGGPPLRDDDIFGNSVTAIGDLDGDGVSEIVVGANGDDLPADNNGVAYVLFLNRDGTVKRFVRLGEGLNGIPAGTLVRNDSFGYRVDAIGDLNQDGIPDLAVHAPGDDTGGPTRGAVYLLFLAADGTVQSHKKLASNLNGVPTLDDGDQLGRGLGVLSDLDGNGVRELAVGTIWNDTEGTDRGAIYILYMESDGTVSRHVRIADGVNGGPSLADGDKFGTHIASVGDLDGDGVHEIAVTALHDDSGNPNQGAVHVLFMNSAPTNPPSLDPIPDRSLDEDQKQIVLLVPAESPGRVDRIDAKTGTLLDSFGEGVLTSPTDVAIGPEGHYYVVDKTNRAVQKFDRATFEYLGRIVGSLGLRDEFPPSLLVRENGNVLVSTGSTVNEYLNDGSDAGDSRQNDVVDMELGRDASLLTLRGGGSAGRYPSTYPSETHSGNSRFSRAVGGGVAFDASGNIFIAETFSADSDNRLVIQKVGSIPSAEENRAASFGESEIFVTLPGLGGVTDIDFGPDHHLYLSDASLNQIIVVDGQTGEIRQRLQNIDQNGHIAVVTLPGLHPQDATIELTGIGDGDGRNQPLSVTAVSNNPSLIPNPTVDYMSNSDSGRLTITPTADQSGIANITVTVMDGGADDDLQTLQDNKSTLRTFQIQIDSSASIAHDDTTVMWRTDIESETIHVPIGELLQNDFLG